MSGSMANVPTVRRYTTVMFGSPLVQTLANFVRRVGTDVHAASSLLPTNFPGLGIQHGAILIDESRVVYPGDILHEAATSH